MADKKPLFDFKPWRYDRFDSPCSDAGSRVKDVLSAKRDKDGNIVVDKVGQIDIYDEIQSHAQSVDLDLIMERYSNGDTSALNRVQGFFGDFSKVPDNWVDVLNVINEGRLNFDKMPNDFKARYGNDFERFVCTFDIKDYISNVKVPPDMPIKKVDEKEVNEKEVNADES